VTAPRPAESFELRAQSLLEEYREANAPRRQLIRWWLKRNYYAISRVCADEDMKGGEKFTCLAVAFQLPEAAMITDAITLEPIVRFTGFDTDTIAIHLKKHERKIVRHPEPKRRGRWRFEFLELGGPLGLRADLADRKIRSTSAERFGSLDRKIRSSDAPSTQSLTESFGRTRSPKKDRARARSGSALKDLLERSTADDPSPAALAAIPVLEAYVRWHNETFPQYNQVDGYRLRKVLKTGDTEAHAVLELLLEGWPLEELQSMTVALWCVQPSPGDRDATFIATSTDRSLHILKHKATYLQAIAVRHRRAGASSVDPSLAARWEQVCDRLSLEGLYHAEVSEYFRTCHLVGMDDDRLTICVPSHEQRELIAQLRPRREGLVFETLEDALRAAVAKCFPGRSVFWFVTRPTKEGS
jgi:hypothetical protein